MIGGNGVHGPVTDIQIVTEQMRKTKHRFTHILAENTGRTFDEVADATERDNSQPIKPSRARIIKVVAVATAFPK